MNFKYFKCDALDGPKRFLLGGLFYISKAEIEIAL